MTPRRSTRCLIEVSSIRSPKSAGQIVGQMAAKTIVHNLGHETMRKPGGKWEVSIESETALSHAHEPLFPDDDMVDQLHIEDFPRFNEAFRHRHILGARGWIA